MIIRTLFSFCTLVHLLLSPPHTHQFRVHPSSTEGVARVNPCFTEPDSDPCIYFIALRRGVSLEEARVLYERARTLFASEETPPAAIYDRATVAVACLASAGTMRPGPDSDCAACGPACGAESRPAVCALYCTRHPQAELKAQSYGTILSEMSGNRSSVGNTSRTLFDQPLVLMIILCLCFVLFSSLLALLMVIAITCRRLSSRKLERVRGTCVSSITLDYN